MKLNIYEYELLNSQFHGKKANLPPVQSPNRMTEKCAI
jgi:hypothetical protein